MTKAHSDKCDPCNMQVAEIEQPISGSERPELTNYPAAKWEFATEYLS